MDDPDVPESGAVFTFGRSRFADNCPSKFWIRRDRVTALSCGDEHTAVVCQSGRLFTFGANEWGQLGLGAGAKQQQQQQPVNKPSCVKSLKSVGAVRAAACGKAHTLVAVEVLNDGDDETHFQLFAFGSNADGQLGLGRAVEFSDRPVRIGAADGLLGDGDGGGRAEAPVLSAGSSHSLALLPREGRVLVWGSNTEGQLGLGDDSEETVYSPVVLNVKLNHDEVVKQVSCGYYHSAFVTSSGRLFVFGDRGGGKLGLATKNGDANQEGEDAKDEDDDDDDDATVYHPTELEMDDRISAVACGGEHTLVLTETGRVYSFGSSANGQLGLGTKKLEAHQPVLITTLAESGQKVEKISCGENHSALVTASGHLITFGDGRHGKLCLDQETLANQHSPAFSDKFAGFRVVSVHCGGCHTMVFAMPLPEGQNGTMTTEAMVNGDASALATAVGSVGNGRPPPLLVGGGADVNRTARERRHHSMQQQQESKALPPIRSRPPLPSDPEEILNIGSELVHVNGGGGSDRDEERDDEGEALKTEDESDKEDNDDDAKSSGSDEKASDEDEQSGEDDEPDENQQKKEGDAEEKQQESKSKFKVSNIFRGFKSWKSDIPVQDDVKKELDQLEEEENELEHLEEAKNGIVKRDDDDEASGRRRRKKLTKKVSFMSQEAVYESPEKRESRRKEGEGEEDGDSAEKSEDEDERVRVKDIEGESGSDGDEAEEEDRRERRKARRGGKDQEETKQKTKGKEEDEKAKKKKSKLCSIL